MNTKIAAKLAEKLPYYKTDAQNNACVNGAEIAIKICKNLKPLPQCCFLDGDGKRCRKKSAIKNRLHLDNMYKYPAWVEVNLCPEHHLHFGGGFAPKKKK